MTRILERIGQGAATLVRVVGEVAAWSGLALVLLVAFNVLARYLFSFGTVGLQEAEWHVMAVSALFGMSYGLNQGAEVRVDVVYEKMSERQCRIVDAVSGMLLTGVAIIVVYLSIGFVESSYSIGEGSPDPGGLDYRWLLKAAMPAAFALLALQAAAMTCANLAAILRSES